MGLEWYSRERETLWPSRSKRRQEVYGRTALRREQRGGTSAELHTNSRVGRKNLAPKQPAIRAACIREDKKNERRF